MATGSSEGYQLSIKNAGKEVVHRDDTLHYVATTQPVQFRNGTTTFVPQEGIIYPSGPDGDIATPPHSCCTVS